MRDKVIYKCSKLKEKGIFVPTDDMIKSSSDIDRIREAGIINSKILDYAIKNIRVGMTTFELDKLVLDYTLKLNAKSAILGYDDFPGSCCISINDCACHGVPSKRTIIKDGDLVKIDCTIIYNGYYADACRSVVVGSNDLGEKLIALNQQIVDYIVKKITPYKSYIGDIGYYISKFSKENNLGVIVELGGHGVGLDFHEEPFIDSIALKSSGILITPGMVFTIEPIFTLGSNKIKHYPLGIRTIDKSITSQIEYTICVLEDRVEILSK